MKIRCLLCLLIGVVLMTGGCLAASAQEPLWSYKTYVFGGDSISVSADGSSLAATIDRIYYFNSRGEKLWSGFGGKKVIFTGDGKFIVAGTDGGIRYLDTTGTTFWEDSQWKPVDVLSMTPDERYIAAIGGTTVSLYSNAGLLLGRNTTLPASTLALSPDATLMVIGTPSMILGLNESGIPKWNYETYENRKLAFAPDSSYVIGASAYSVLALHPSGNLLWSYRTANTVLDIAISSDSTRVAAGGLEKKVFLFDRNGNLLWSREIGDPASCVAVTRDGSFVAAGSGRGLDKKVYLFSGGGDLLWTYQAGGWVNGIDFSGDGKYLAAVTDDGVVSYFSTAYTPPATAVITTVPQVRTTATTGPATTKTVAVSPTAVETTKSPVSATTSQPVQPGPTKAGCAPFETAIVGLLSAGIFLSVKRRGK